MFSGDSLQNPLNFKRHWSSVGITEPDLLVSLGVNVTAFHMEDCGFPSFGMMLYGGYKVWIIIQPEHKNILKFVQLVNQLKLDRHGAAIGTCPGIMNDRSTFIMPEVLETYGVKFSVVSGI
jgi:hypothetical protein